MSQTEKEIIVGIDLGTTNSLVAVMDSEGLPRVLPNAGGENLIPSMVGFSLSGDPETIGADARKQRVAQATRTVYSVKRFMGKGLDEVKEETGLYAYKFMTSSREAVRIQVGDKKYTPTEISSMILKRLKENAEKALGKPVKKAVITVPAYFNDIQRQVTKDAGKLAGLEVMRIINEPTAAALAYGFDKTKDGIVAVYDLGGGTFDLSILKLQAGVFEVLATHGNTRLGGDDFDHLLMEELLRRAGQKIEIGTEKWMSVLEEAERVKIALSTKETVTANVDEKKFSVSRQEFEKLISGFLEETLEHCRKALKDADKKPGEIDEVILVGGSSRIPAVRQGVAFFFGRDPHIDLDPDQVVAQGAAVQADILAHGRTDLLLLDVTPLSLGIESVGGIMEKIIFRNTHVPCGASQEFTTSVDGQTNIAFHVLQGEREFVQDNQSLAKFTLSGIDPLPAGLPRIEVTFALDANGILRVTAKDKRGEKEISVEVKPMEELTEEKVDSMVEDSIENAQSDVNARFLVEGRHDADVILRATEKMLDEHGEELPEKDVEKIRSAWTKLKKVRESAKDHHILKDAIESLEHVTHTFAEKIINETISAALKEKSVEEVKA